MRKKSKGDMEDYIFFADPEVGRVLHANGLIANANKSSIEELASITTLNPSIYPYTAYFYNNKVITKFPELKYCTGLSNLWGVFSGCSNLTEVGIIPEGVTDMRDTFQNCTSLVNAPTIPSNVTNMNNTFNSCYNLTEAPIIPEGVTNMDMAFSNCRNLVNAPIIPDSVTSMSMTFSNCYRLVNAPVIPDSVTNMSMTFFRCSNLDGIFVIKPINPPSYSDTLTETNVVAIYVPDESVDTYKNASGWSEFADKIYPMSDYWDGIFADPEVGRVLHANGLIADANKSSIEELATITSLGSYFEGNKVIRQFPELQYCTGLTSLYGAFNGCSNLITVGDIPQGVTNMNTTFSSCTKLTTAPVLPSSVTDMGGTFRSCVSLTTTPIVPEGVTNLRETFNGCSSLVTAPAIPSSVTNLFQTFNGCTKLTTAPIIPEGVTSLYATFIYCSSLTTTPVLPSSVTDLTMTFLGCSSIDGIYIINRPTPPTYNNSFSNIQAIYVPDESVDTYKSRMGWRDFASKIYPMSQSPK